MLWHDGLAFESLHLDRMTASATHFRWPFHRQSAEVLIASRVRSLQAGADFQLCLRLTSDGGMRLRVSRFYQKERHGRVRLTRHVTPAEDVFRRHQTTCRDLYDRLLPEAQREGFDDILFSNSRGELTEGAIHNVFIKRGDKLLTPPVASGVLPGVYRRYVLETNSCAAEEVLRPQDLETADTVYLTSSLVGMYPVEVVTSL